MIKAIAIHDEFLNENGLSVHEMPDAMMKASYLLGVESYLVELKQIRNFQENGVINAFRYTNDGYQPCNIDMPEFFVYNYPLGVKKDESDLYQWLWKHTTMLNTPGVGKDILQKKMLTTDLALYAIPSYIITSFQDAFRMLSLIQNAILKPLKGSMGKGILRVTKEGNEYYCQTSSERRIFSEEFYSSYLISSGFHPNSPMILEPCLNILTDEGRAVDFRCQTSLDGQGKWKNVLTYARIGASEVVSNISHGGSVTFAHEALELFAPGRGKEILKEINRVAIRTSELVEDLSEGQINCLGIDICFDRDSERIYVIEANAGPGFKIVGPWPLALTRAEYFKYRLSLA